MDGILSGKRVLVTGGTGSLGSTLVRRLLCGHVGRPASITVFSRDEAKQHAMRLALAERAEATDEIVFADWQ
jgi:FlaA1/EpsC-like NDP-sugar epimerase